MKKLLALLLALLCLFCLVACGINKHTCRPLDGEEIIDLLPSSLDEPFVTDEERDELLNKAIRKYLCHGLYDPVRYRQLLFVEQEEV